MLKISYAYAHCAGLSPAILVQFTVEMCAETENCKKNSKTFCRLRFKVIKDHQC